MAVWKHFMDMFYLTLFWPKYIIKKLFSKFPIISFFFSPSKYIYLRTFFGDVTALYQWLPIVHQNHSRSLFIIIEEKCIWIQDDHLTSFQHVKKIICTFGPLSVDLSFSRQRLVVICVYSYDVNLHDHMITVQSGSSSYNSW